MVVAIATLFVANASSGARYNEWYGSVVEMLFNFIAVDPGNVIDLL